MWNQRSSPPQHLWSSCCSTSGRGELDSVFITLMLHACLFGYGNLDIWICVIKIAKIKIQGLNMLSKTAQCPFNRPLMLYSSSPRILSFLDSHTYFYFSTFEKQLRALFVPSLHPYQIPGSSGSTLIRAAQAAVSRATSSKRLLGHPEAFPDQLEYYNPSRVFWASSQSDVPRIPPRGGFRETS